MDEKELEKKIKELLNSDTNRSWHPLDIAKKLEIDVEEVRGSLRNMKAHGEIQKPKKN